MLSDEEKQAIERIDYIIDFIIENDTYYAGMGDIQHFSEILELIRKQSKKLEEYKKQLDLDYVDKNFIRIDKIKAKIEELKEDEKREIIMLNPSAKDGCVTNVSHEEEIKVLQSLLGKE